MIQTHKQLLYIIAAVIIASGMIILSFTLPQIFSKKHAHIASAGEVNEMNVIVRSPKPPGVSVYEAGATVNFNAFIGFYYCGNSWGKPVGQISRPVPYGTAHTGMTSGIKDGQVVSRSATTYGVGQYAFKYNTQYSENFTAPSRPGNYWFRYKVGVQNGQGTNKFTEGVAVFQVVARDICVNVPGRQERVPGNYFQTINTKGEPVCFEYGDRSLICKASNNPILPGETVEYSAETASGQPGNFKWFNGGSTYGSVIKTDLGVPRTTFSRSYSSPGMYLVSALVEVNGELDQCVMGVTVSGDGEDQVKLDEGNGAFDIDESRIFIDGDEIFYLNPAAGAGEIDFNLDSGLTNRTCKATWNAQNVLKCDLYKNEQFFEKLDKQGEKDLSPGVYQIKCLQARDGSEIESERRTCRQNPNVMEI